MRKEAGVHWENMRVEGGREPVMQAHMGGCKVLRALGYMPLIPLRCVGL